MIGFLGNDTFETGDYRFSKVHRGTTKRLTFSSVEFDHVQGESNLLERVVFLREGDTTLE
jgi:hypothetical protein